MMPVQEGSVVGPFLFIIHKSDEYYDLSHNYHSDGVS